MNREPCCSPKIHLFIKMETIKAIIPDYRSQYSYPVFSPSTAATIVDPFSLLYLENMNGSHFMNGEHSTMDT